LRNFAHEGKDDVRCTAECVDDGSGLIHAPFVTPVPSTRGCATREWP
jgi:hypothetical protein